MMMEKWYKLHFVSMTLGFNGRRVSTDTFSVCLTVRQLPLLHIYCRYWWSISPTLTLKGSFFAQQMHLKSGSIDSVQCLCSCHCCRCWCNITWMQLFCVCITIFFPMHTTSLVRGHISDRKGSGPGQRSQCRRIMIPSLTSCEYTWILNNSELLSL